MGHHEEEETLEASWIALLIASITGIIGEYLGYHAIVDPALSLIGTLLILRFLLLTREGRFTVDIIMGGVAWILYLADKPFEGFIILAIYALAETMEEYAEHMALGKLSKLLEILPSQATREKNGKVEVVPINEVSPGDTLVVAKGQVVPADGILLTQGTFDTSLVTGEPIPVEQQPRDIVYSGYINIGNPVKIRVTRPPKDSSLQKTVNLALSLLEKKSKVERTIERVAPAYTVVLFGLAGLSLPLLGLNALVSILVAGCPSAFLLTASILSLTTVASMSRKGVVVKGGNALERLSTAKTVVFDKTGTLTLGRPVLSRIIAPPGVDRYELLAAAASLAATSSHPLSRGIIESVRKLGIEIPVSTRAREIPGQGLEGYINGSHVKLGKSDFVAAHDDRPCGDGEASVYVSLNGAVGVLCFADRLEEKAVETIKMLKQRGYRVVLASGDRPDNVSQVASKLGVGEWYGGLKPEDKQRLVTRLRKESGPVVVVGDGVNDIVAMSEADAAVAVGDVNVVSEVADAVIREGGIKRLVNLLASATGFRAGILLGFAVAVLVKLASMAAGTVGIVPLWVVALIGDDGSTFAGIGAGLAIYAIYTRKSGRR